MKLEKWKVLNRRLQEEFEATAESTETFYGLLAMLLLSYKKLICQIVIMLMSIPNNRGKENDNERDIR